VGGGDDPAVIAVLIPPGTPAREGAIGLAPSEIHHLQVRRARTGDTVRVFDGEGWTAEGTLELGPGLARVRVEREQRSPRPLPLALAVGAGDRDRFGWLVEKAAELGVTEVIPLETERTAAVATRVRGAQLARLRRRASEALKQSHLSWAPRVQPPETVAALAHRPARELRWLADRDGTVPPASLPAEPMLIVVGPEGGFTAAERELLLQGAFQPISLGHGILRFETAALTAAVAALHARLRGPNG